MRHIFIALLISGSILSACTGRNRVGTQGNTGDGGVQSTATKYPDSNSAGQAARDKHGDSTMHHADSTMHPRDTMSRPHR